MSNIKAVTLDEFATRRWRPMSGYRFAEKETSCFISAQEATKAMLTYPIALIRASLSYVPIVLLGIEPGRNLFIDPSGQWLNAYIPFRFRLFPFVVAQQQDASILCIDETSGALTDDVDGERFFDDFGKPTERMSQIISQLSQFVEQRSFTLELCEQLNSLKLIKPWPLKLLGKDGEQVVEGLFAIDEAALLKLPLEQLGAVRNSGALLFAYAQLLSMQNVHNLLDLHHHSRTVSHKSATGSPIFDLSVFGEVINLDHL